MLMIEKVFTNQVDYSQNVSRVNILQILECCSIIQMMSFKFSMNVNYDWKSVLKLLFSRKKKC